MQQFQNHGELVPTQSRNAVGFPHLRAQPRAKGLQQGIARRVAQTVIDAFEMVDVHVKQRHGLLAATAALHGGRQVQQKRPPVIEPGKRVLQGLRDQVLFGQLTRDAVVHKSDKAGSVDSRQRRERHLHAEFVPLAMQCLHRQGAVQQRPASSSMKIREAGVVGIPKTVRNDDIGKPMADHFIRSPAKKHLGPMIPVGNHAIGIHADARFVRCFQDGVQTLTLQFMGSERGDG